MSKKEASTSELPLVFRIAGVTFEGRQDKLQTIIDSKTFQTLGAVEVTLEREPKNKFDTNAIKVVYRKDHLGYMPKEMAAEVAPLFDAKGKKKWGVTSAFITSIGNANGIGPLGARVEALLEKK